MLVPALVPIEGAGCPASIDRARRPRRARGLERFSDRSNRGDDRRPRCWSPPWSPSSVAAPRRWRTAGRGDDRRPRAGPRPGPRQGAGRPTSIDGAAGRGDATRFPGRRDDDAGPGGGCALFRARYGGTAWSKPRSAADFDIGGAPASCPPARHYRHAGSQAVRLPLSRGRIYELHHQQGVFPAAVDRPDRRQPWRCPAPLAVITPAITTVKSCPTSMTPAGRGDRYRPRDRDDAGPPAAPRRSAGPPATVAMIDALDAGPRRGAWLPRVDRRRRRQPWRCRGLERFAQDRSNRGDDRRPRGLVPALVPVKAMAAPRRSTAPPATVAMQGLGTLCQDRSNRGDDRRPRCWSPPWSPSKRWLPHVDRPGPPAVAMQPGPRGRLDDDAGPPVAPRRSPDRRPRRSQGLERFARPFQPWR